MDLDTTSNEETMERAKKHPIDHALKTATRVGLTVLFRGLYYILGTCAAIVCIPFTIIICTWVWANDDDDNDEILPKYIFSKLCEVFNEIYVTRTFFSDLY